MSQTVSTIKTGFLWLAQGAINFWLVTAPLFSYNRLLFKQNCQMIVQELRSPQKTFKVGEDGTETVEYKAPNSLMLRAANTIEQLQRTIQVLEIELTNIRNGVQ